MEQKPQYLDAQSMKQQLKDRVDQDFSLIATLHKEHFVPFMDAASEGLRSTVTLSAGAIVASISVAQLLAEKDHQTETTFGWLLHAGWLLLTLAMLLALVRGHFYHKTRAVAYRMYQYRGGIIDAIDGAGTVEAAEALMYEQRNAAVKESHGQIESAVNADKWLWPLSALSFLAGIAALVVYAVLNVPA